VAGCPGFVNNGGQDLDSTLGPGGYNSSIDTHINVVKKQTVPVGKQLRFDPEKNWLSK
jgi:hypothetical protein